VRSRLQVSPERYHQIARAALVLLTLIVFTGAAVRLTGSGLGCPDWPKCTDDRLVAELDTHGLIEFVNRVFSGLVALAAVAAGALAFFRVPYRRDLMLLGMLLPLGVLGQGVLGGLTVIYDLRPGFVMSHFGLSMLVLIAAWALHWRSRPSWEQERDFAQDSPPDRVTLWATRLLVPIGALAIFAGTAATASGPHAGGAGTGDVVSRLDVKGTGTLDWAIHQHGYVASAIGVTALIALTLALLRRAGRELVTALGVVLGLLVVQGAVGAVQYALELPAEIVWVHVCLATCTWVAILWTWSAAGLPASAPVRTEAHEPLGAPAG
jgi:cytochrome c oxidase assembly protein subunit 15